MKGLFIGVSLAALLFTLSGIAFIQYAGMPSYDWPIPKIHLPEDSTSVAYGGELVQVLCADCHRGKHTTRLVGKEVRSMPEAWGKVYSANITKDSVHGIGRYSSGELYRMLRTGIKKNNKLSAPFMPHYPIMAENDICSIIAFLQSDHPIVKPDPKPSTPIPLSFTIKALSRTILKPSPYPKQLIKRPIPSDTIALGRYIATGLGSCFSCHSSDFRTNDLAFPEQSKGYLSGGNKMRNLTGEYIRTPGLRFEPGSSMEGWSLEEFGKALRYGEKPDGTILAWPMPKWGILSDVEINALYHYLLELD